MKNIFWAQHENLSENSYLFVNEEQIENFNSPLAKDAMQQLMADGKSKKYSYKAVKEIKFLKSGFIITGNLNSKDELGRSMGYNCFIHEKNAEEMENYIITIVKDTMLKEIEEKDLNRIQQILKKKDYKFMKILLVLLITVILILVFLYEK